MEKNKKSILLRCDEELWYKIAKVSLEKRIPRIELILFAINKHLNELEELKKNNA